MSATPVQTHEYPVQFSVDYPDRSLNRLTTAFRMFVAIPILILIAALANATWQCGSTKPAERCWRASSIRARPRKWND